MAEQPCHHEGIKDIEAVALQIEQPRAQFGRLRDNSSEHGKAGRRTRGEGQS
ncbi:hypothetical protein [Mesorhizobium sp. B3-1-9]|uniref:hypothetical protein n=1 Tax=Mesorhizobium sp. B3-1-9 TaxID=2589892 RepID=UPI0015E3FB35|nr:hypothetical protein [Mesorhizobium sp. B3-1-9]